MENHSKDTYRQDDLRNIGDERVELLETIRMMVDQEVERKFRQPSTTRILKSLRQDAYCSDDCSGGFTSI